MSAVIDAVNDIPAVSDRSRGRLPAAGPRYWIAVVSQQAADAAVAGSYLEVSYGKAGPLERMAPGDGVVVYCPRERDEHGAPVQSFTALGRVAEGALYQLAQNHQPFRRAVRWLPATPASVRPLLDTLSFIRNKTHWGTPFRYGFLRIPPADFGHIAAAMRVDWPDALPSTATAEPTDAAEHGAQEGVAA